MTKQLHMSTATANDAIRPFNISSTVVTTEAIVLLGGLFRFPFADYLVECDHILYCADGRCISNRRHAVLPSLD